MTRALSRVSTALLSLLVLVLAVPISGCASTGGGRHFKSAKGTNVIVVGKKASEISIDELHLSYADSEVAFWVAREKSKKLYIEFDREVFENMARQANGRYRVTCQKRQCYSDEIKLYDPQNPANNKFKYWQILDDGTAQDTADGIIIIDP